MGKLWRRETGEQVRVNTYCIHRCQPFCNSGSIWAGIWNNMLKDKTSMLFRYEAPEMFRWLQNVTWLFSSVWVRRPGLRVFKPEPDAARHTSMNCLSEPECCSYTCYQAARHSLTLNDHSRESLTHTAPLTLPVLVSVVQLVFGTCFNDTEQQVKLSGIYVQFCCLFVYLFLGFFSFWKWIWNNSNSGVKGTSFIQL